MLTFTSFDFWLVKINLKQLMWESVGWFIKFVERDWDNSLVIDFSCLRIIMERVWEHLLKFRRKISFL